VLVSSADVEELVALSHRILVLREGRIVAELSGSAVTPSDIAFHSLGGQVAAA
jgi:ribose transport system ATP-binding protein